MNKIYTSNKNNLPLTPHLQIYKWQINMIMSIMHRVSGVAIYTILLIFSWLFCFNIIWPECSILNTINNIIQSPFGKLSLTFCSFFLYYHILNGLRHLFWDVGHGFEIQTMKFTGVLILLCSFSLTIITAFFLFF
jgi:succinate dehydrogenase / fumarate reductase cytochrome b subunit